MLYSMFMCRQSGTRSRWTRWALPLVFLIAGYANAIDNPIVPPQIDLPATQLPQFPIPSPYIPDIPWQPPAPRLNVKAPFAPKFLAGNNIFTGEKEFWLADAVAGTYKAWPKRFDDTSICDYLNQLARNIGLYSHEPSKQYDVTVVDVPYANAFTAGGGHIYITRQMLRDLNTEDELAGVIAHEMGHDNFHHAGRTMTRQFFWVIGVTKVNSFEETKRDFLKFVGAYDPEHNPWPALGEAISGIERADEQSADKAAFYFLYKAGYNPLAMADYFRRMPDPTLAYLKSETGAAWPVFWTISLLFDSHPPNGMRAAALDWESNFVGAIPRDSRVDATAFSAMKNHLKFLDAQDAEKARELRKAAAAAASQVKILMPVVVKDAAGKPSTDLKVSDFSVSGPKDVSIDRMWLVPPQTVSDEDPRTSVFLVYDAVNTDPPSDLRTKRIRSFLSMVAKDRAPVTFFINTANGLQLIYEATTPPEVLSSALTLTENRHAKSADPEVEQQAKKLRLLSTPIRADDIERLRSGAEGLIEVAHRLRGSDKRKAVIWLTNEPYLEGHENLYEITVETLNAAHISVYPNLLELGGSAAGNAKPEAIHNQQRLADCTGGMGLGLTKDSMWDALQATLADFGSYYILGVALPVPKETDWKPIGITVNRPGLTVRAAPGFVGLKPLRTMQVQAPQP